MALAEQNNWGVYFLFFIIFGSCFLNWFLFTPLYNHLHWKCTCILQIGWLIGTNWINAFSKLNSSLGKENYDYSCYSLKVKPSSQVKGFWSTLPLTRADQKPLTNEKKRQNNATPHTQITGKGLRRKW